MQHDNCMQYHSIPWLFKDYSMKNWGMQKMMVPAVSSRHERSEAQSQSDGELINFFFFSYDTMSAMNVPCAWIILPRSREVVARCFQEGVMNHPVGSAAF